MTRDSRGRFSSLSSRPAYIVIAVGVDRIDPTPSLRREVLAPRNAPVKPTMAISKVKGNLALAIMLVAGCTAWAIHIGVI